jgi:ER membrane protein complex subunit 1, C-terminal
VPLLLQLSVVELYEKAAFDMRAALLGSANRTASSWAPPDLEASLKLHMLGFPPSASVLDAVLSVLIAYGRLPSPSHTQCWAHVKPHRRTMLLLRDTCTPGAQVLRDSYFWASQVKAAAVTTTARGITSKMLLLGTTADQVCCVVVPCDW